MPGMPDDLRDGARIFREHIEECASLTDRPFAVNIPVGVDRHSGEIVAFTDVYIREILAARQADSQLAAQLRVMTTSAGFPGPYIPMIKDSGMVHQHKVGSTRQAIKAAEAGVDVIIAAGFEMGGHAPAAGIHTFVLVPSVAEAVDIPVLLTGGARDGRTLAAALCLGADGVALGTRFILSTENTDWHPGYLNALLKAREGDDVAFDGVYGPCRGLRNAASEALLAERGDPDAGQAELIRRKIGSMQRAQTTGDVENSLVMTGQVAGAITQLISIASFVPEMADQARIVLDRLCRLQ
jgi:enoyl-[acyl-carrier protein] reductase II